MLIATALFASSLPVLGAPVEDAWLPQLEVELARQAAGGQFAGAVRVAHDGVTVFEAAFGEADIALRKPGAATHCEPGDPCVVVVLANRDPPAAMEIDRFVTRWLAPLP